MGATNLRRASRAFARPALPLVRTVSPSASLNNGAHSAPSEVGLVPYDRSGAKGAFPEMFTAMTAAAAAAVALTLSSSRQEDESAPVLAAGAYSIPIGRASPDVVSVLALFLFATDFGYVV